MQRQNQQEVKNQDHQAHVCEQAQKVLMNQNRELLVSKVKKKI